ncbi:glycosyltransferase [Lentzea sp. HUAS TT2]|uniref:glycosyltransferase n=1 Tax=Lentzea sp. HUAS TT2 TaxID=3447454 RepID=UPI003F6FFF74
MTTSLCLIVKDEERFLRECVISARGLADQVVIVDTGSTDRTLEIATELADVVDKVPFAGDFAAARNAALEHAQGDWIVFLDADEQFPAGEAEALRGVLRETPADVLGLTLLRYNFFGTGGFYSSRELKVFRNRAGVRYERPVNESVTAAVEREGGRIAPAPVVLNHFGQCRDVESRESKAVRYLALMDEGLRQSPDDPWFHAFSGLILRTLGRMDEAITAAQQALLALPDHPVIHLFHGHVVRATDTAQRALDCYRTGLELAPGDPALLNMVGVQLLATGRPEEADEHFVAARAAEPRLQHIDINRGLVAQSQRRWADAADLFGSVAAANPGFLHEEWPTRTERDYFRCTHFETPFGYAGLAYHLAYARMRAAS